MSTHDWRQKFLDLYKEVAACEAPEGTQVDDVLAKYQADFEDGNTGKAQGSTGFGLEILHVRHPDYSCQVTLFVDGKQVRHDEIDIDPGRGYSREEWDQATKDDVGQVGRSEAFTKAAASAYEAASGSQYIEEDRR